MNFRLKSISYHWRLLLMCASNILLMSCDYNFKLETDKPVQIRDFQLCINIICRINVGADKLITNNCFDAISFSICRT